MAQEILPPKPKTWPVDDGRGEVTVRAPGIPLPPGQPVRSGHWWVYLPGYGEQYTNINDHILYWPRGIWFVVEDKHFHVLMDTDFHMLWLNGVDLYEKEISTHRAPTRTGAEYRKIGSRLVSSGSPDIDDRYICRGLRGGVIKALPSR